MVTLSMTFIDPAMTPNEPYFHVLDLLSYTGKSYSLQIVYTGRLYETLTIGIKTNDLQVGGSRDPFLIFGPHSYKAKSKVGLSFICIELHYKLLICA